MIYRNSTPYRSWNASALGIKQEVPENDLSYKDRQRRRDSWSSRATRGRGSWSIDNRPQNRRRNTVPNSSQEFNHHVDNHESDKQLESNPILEEHHSSTFPTNDHCDLNNDNDYKDKSSYFNNNRKKRSDNIYNPPKSTSYHKDWKSNSSNDDGSRSYYSRYESNYNQWNDWNDRNDGWERGSINHEPEPDQRWLHDKFESLENEETKHITKNVTDNNITFINNITEESATDNFTFTDNVTEENVTENMIEKITEKITENVVTENVTENVTDNTDNVIESVSETLTKNVTNSKNKKDASTQVSPSDISNEIFNNKIAISSKEMNEPKSPVDSGRAELEFPDEITIKVAGLTLKDSDVDKPESVATQTSSSETESEITSETVTPKDEELPILINLDEDDNADKQITQPKISEDILSLDWPGYQKTLIEKEYMEEYKRLSEMSTTRKPDTNFDFDLLSLIS